ncbi:MAG: hypothetical protein MI723_10065 [Caulobacterales bacterium]|nr:hypothetical protein [Caulobacterales bacterium]
MRRAHRSAHAVIWLLLAPLIAALIWAGLTVRPPPPSGELPAAAQELLQGDG